MLEKILSFFFLGQKIFYLLVNRYKKWDNSIKNNYVLNLYKQLSTNFLTKNENNYTNKII